MDTLELVKKLEARRGFFLNGAAWTQSTMPDTDCILAADKILRLHIENQTLRATVARLDAR